MKKGDKVVCIYDGGKYGGKYPDITKDKIYTIYDIHLSTKLSPTGRYMRSLQLRGDRGFLQYWTPDIFITLKDQRKQKINKIYENNLCK